ncbi:MAG: hypothetical protein IAE90_07430 [Ignavibacteria bacterium]|nr:hypothetical protein [Ignavibacteria bacterium]
MKLSKWIKAFILGEHSRGVTLEMLREMVDEYDPDFHEAPLIVRHDYEETKEPEKIADVSDIRLDGNQLYVRFKNIASNASDVTSKFSRPSIEIGKYKKNGKDVTYLRAVACTNFPQIKGVDRIPFGESGYVACFSENVKFTFSDNNKSKNTMNKFVEKLAKFLGLQFTEKTTLEDLNAEKVVAKFEEMTGDMAKLKKENEELKAGKAPAKKEDDLADDTKYSELKKEIADLKAKGNKEKAQLLVDTAFSAGKIEATQKESLLAFAEGNFEGAQKFIEGLPVNPLFKEKQVQGKDIKLDTGAEKFKDSEGKQITYQSILEKPELALRFSEAEIGELEKEWKKNNG